MPSYIVPWFSKHEWMEVYEGIFGNDIEKWKEARDTILVWQARVIKLPIGLDLTLPLLQARIAEADPLMDTDVKSIIQGTALQRFVTNVVKLPQTEYYQHQTLTKLANQIGLPGHLVDLRNEIIHGSQSGYAGGCTISGALDTAFKWIKNYYWLQQLQQMGTKEDKMIERLKRSPPQRKFLTSLTEYAKISVQIQNESEIKQVLEKALFRFEKAYSAGQQECVENIVVHLLTSSTLQKSLEKKLACGCFSNLKVMKNLESILTPILETEGVTTLMLVILIKKAQEHKGIYMKWLKLIVTSLLDLSATKGNGKVCNEHLLGIGKKHPNVNWKKVVLHLLYIEEEWASHLAISVINAPDISFSKEKVERLMNLVKLRSSGGKKGKNTSEDAEDEIFDVQSVLDRVKHTQECEGAEATNIMSSLSLSKSGILAPLGVLPHQMKNKFFYKELLLHFPRENDVEPSRKRMKT